MSCTICRPLLGLDWSVFLCTRWVNMQWVTASLCYSVGLWSQGNTISSPSIFIGCTNCSFYIPLLFHQRQSILHHCSCYYITNRLFMHLTCQSQDWRCCSRLEHFCMWQLYMCWQKLAITENQPIRALHPAPPNRIVTHTHQNWPHQNWLL